MRACVAKGQDGGLQPRPGMGQEQQLHIGRSEKSVLHHDFSAGAWGGKWHVVVATFSPWLVGRWGWEQTLLENQNEDRVPFYGGES
jgi:hypothetical protein